MFVETVETLSTGISTFEIIEKAFPTFRKIYSRLRNGELRIAIFGAGGTGKTTLGKLLTGKFDVNNLLLPYQESIGIENYQLDGNILGSIIVAPGQERRENTWNDILRLLTNGKVQIVINVVSWGYHSFGELSYKETEFYQNSMSDREFVKSLSNNRRGRELKLIGKLAPYLEISNLQNILMITLVTKQDLWWKNREEVKKHYMEGDYNTYIQEIIRKKGSDKFFHEYLSASLVISNFISGRKEPFILTAEGYDQNLQTAHLKILFDTIENFAERTLKK